MSTVKSFLKDTSIYGVGNALQKFIGMLLLPLYTRLLTPEDYGVLNTLVTFTYFIGTFFMFGIYFGGQNRYFFQAKDEKEKSTVLSTSLWLSLISGGLILLTLPFSNQISKLLFNDERWWTLVVVSILAIPVNSISALQDSIYRLYRAPQKYLVVTVLRALINPLLGIVLVYFLGFGALGVNMASSFTALFLVVFSFFYFTRDKYNFSFSPIFAKKMMLFGLPLIPAAIAQWALSMSDRFFLLHYSTLSEIGFYSIATTFAQPVLFISAAIEMSATVLLLQNYENEYDIKKPDTKRMIVRFWYIYLFLSVTVASIISIFASDIIGFVSTEKYLKSAIGVPFAAFSYILMAGATHLGIGLVLKERTAPISYMIMIAAIANITLNLYFVPEFGYVGASITTLISSFLFFIFSYSISNRVFYIKSGILRVLIYILISLILSILPSYLSWHHKYEITLGFKFILCSVAILLPVVLRIFSLNDLKSLKNIFLSKFLH